MSTFIWAAFFILCVCYTQTNARTYSVHKTEFVDLDMDTTYMILENSEITELISLAEINKYFQLLATNVFKRLYSTKIIKFVTPFSRRTGRIYEVKRDENHIYIDTYETALKVLKHFGHLIQNIKLGVTGFDDRFIALNNLISYCCSKTLKSLEFHTHGKGVFDYFVKPFIALESLTLFGTFQSLRSKALNKTIDVFPSLRSIVFQNVDFKDKSSIDRNFPHLQHAHLDLHLRKMNKELVTKLIKMNPQIRKLVLIHPMISLLNHISEDLQQLKELEMSSYQEIDLNFVEYDIHLDSIKRLKMSNGFFSMPINTTFKSLVEYETDAWPEYCNRWIEFIEQNNGLQVIRVNKRFLPNDQFARVAKARLDLRSFTGKCESNIDIENIFTMIERNSNLQRMQIEFDGDDTEFLDKTVQMLRKKLVDYHNEPLWAISNVEREIKLEKLEY